MAGIYHPSRGGTRGGKDQFNWDDVKTDKERENYLGHSLMVPVGKWQEGKDLMWYTRDKKTNLSEKELKKKQELKAVKDLEARAMAAALGHKSFTTGTTSLTAKELQDVLSRGQTEHTEGERIQGVGHKKKLSSSKTEKSGITFDGFDASGRNDNETYEEKDQSLKKKKNKKEKKKKKKKKIQASDDEESDVEISTNRRRRYSSSENTGKNRHNERKIDPTDKRGRENTRHRHYEDKNKRRDDDRRVSPHRRRRSISPRDSYRRQRSRSHSVGRHKNVNRKHSNDYRQSSRRQSRSPIRKLTPPHRHDKKRRYRHSNNSSDEDRRR